MSGVWWFLLGFGLGTFGILFVIGLCEAAKRGDEMIKRSSRMGMVVLLIIFTSSVAFAAPFLICDPQAGVQFYRITGDPFWTGNVPAQLDGSIKSDLLGIAIGTHSIQVSACSELWGCSTPSPFSFTRPALQLPGALTITK